MSVTVCACIGLLECIFQTVCVCVCVCVCARARKRVCVCDEDRESSYMHNYNNMFGYNFLLNYKYFFTDYFFNFKLIQFIVFKIKPN